MIKGSPTDPNADFLRGGQQEVLQDAIDAGDITIVGEAYTDGWLPANAQRNMEQILTANDNNVDAVVASNDGTAGGVVAALTAQGMDGIPVSGQDGDHAALNRVAKGTQTVSVWKDARDLGARRRNRRGHGERHRDGRDIDGAHGSGPRPGGTTMTPVPRAGPDHRRTTSTSWSTPAGSRRTLCQGVERPGALQLMTNKIRAASPPAPPSDRARFVMEFLGRQADP
jgi:D-xylose transport system substrate-binding protein